MKCMRTRNVGDTKGFTLVELLVVIAIIGILASITVPNVVKWLGKGNMTKAVAEIKNADTQLTGILVDTGKSKFRDFLKKKAKNNDPKTSADTYFYDVLDANGNGKDELVDLFAVYTGTEYPTNPTFTNYHAIQKFYNEFFYELLRQGRDSDLIQNICKDEVIAKLGTGYMELPADPWDNQYNFWMGPHRRGIMPLRSYRLQAGMIPDDDDFFPFIWTGAARSVYNERIPGQPKADNGRFFNAFQQAGIDPANYNFSPVTQNNTDLAFGYPAPKDMAVYIWSSGPNLENDALVLNQYIMGNDDEAFLGGGDDPNNWDSDSGWDDAPE